MTNPDFNDANIVAVLKMPGNSSIKFQAADLIEAQAAQLAAANARIAEAEKVIKRALPMVEDNAYWHRDMQSHATILMAAFDVFESARAWMEGKIDE